MRTVHSRNSRINWIVIVMLVVGVSASLFTLPAVRAQSAQPPALDLILLIDNSCSMFKPDTPGCIANTPGTDSNFLRVRGAELFAARLAFGQLQPQDRIGAISFGGDYEVTYPLTTITEFVRNDLALKVENPRPRGATQVMGALEAAYSELTRGSGSGNRPAIVFLTDGVPDPKGGQSFLEIANLINQHPDIPIYTLLLQNQKDRTDTEYPSYIEAWKNFQTQVNNIKVYEVKDAAGLLEVYYQVIKDLNVQPYGPPPVHLAAGQTQEFYVSRYARCVVVTVAHPDKHQRGQVEITDLSGQLLKAGEAGVTVFNQYHNGPDNPIEVYSACGPRLQGQTGAKWLIKAVGVDFSFFVEVGGAYEFQWVWPAASPAPLPGVLILDQPIRPTDSTNLQFRLVMNDGTLISDPQQISGEVKTPDGQALVLPDNLLPDNQGVYSLPFQANSYSSTEGWYEIKLQSEDPQQPAGDPSAVIAVKTVRMNIDKNAQPIAPITPTFTPTATPTLASTSAPITVTPPPTPPPLPCPGPGCLPDPDPLPFIILAVIGLLVGGYILARVLKKPPEGFVVLVEGGQVGTARSLQGMAKGKIWKWWEVNVGPKGDLRIKPNQPAGAGLAMPNDEAQAQPEPVTLPGGMKISSAASTGRGTKPPASKRQTTRRNRPKDAVAKFVRDGDSTQFVKLDPRSTRTLKDARDTVMIGNIELRIGLTKDKLM